MISSRTANTRVLAVAALFALAACATTHPVSAPATTSIIAPRSATSSASVPVKIGQPYQVLGRWYHPADDRGYDITGVASWYGPGFHGLSTANGEPYNQDGLTAAHKTLPLPCYVEVTNLENGRQLVVRVNDRGPFIGERLIDLSRRSAQLLGIDRAGTAKVRVRRVYPDAVTIAALAPPKPVVVAAAASLTAALSTSATAPASTGVDVTIIAVPPSAPAVALPASQPLSSGSPLVTAGSTASGTIFVQVAALSDQGRAAWLSGYLKPYGATVIERASAGLWRVRLGPYQSRSQATPILAQVQAAGYTAAQIVAATAAKPTR